MAPQLPGRPFQRLGQAQQRFRENNPGGLLERGGEAISGQNPLFNFGTGLLAAAAPRPVGTSSFGSRLGEAFQFANERSQAATRNQLVRERLQALQEQRQRQQAVSNLINRVGPQDPNMVGPPAPGRGMFTAEQAQLLRALPQEQALSIIAQRGGLLGPQEPQQFGGSLGELFNNLDLARQRGDEAAVQAFETAIENELGSDTDVDFSEVFRVRQDFERDSEPFIIQREGFERIRQSAENPSPAGDLVLLSGLAQVLDPGVRVRPSQGQIEFSSNVGSLGQRIAADFNRVFKGERLEEGQRADYLNQSQRIYGRAQEAQTQRIEDLRGFAERNNLPFVDLVPPRFMPTELGEVTVAEDDEDSVIGGAASAAGDLAADAVSAFGDDEGEVIDLGDGWRVQEIR